MYCKEIRPVNPKRNQSWIFIRRTDAEAEAPIFWQPDSKSWHSRKDPDAGKDWRQEEKRMTEDVMIGSHHWFNGHDFEQALGDGEGQGSLACCSPWGYKELDKTEWLSNIYICVYIHVCIYTCVCKYKATLKPVNLPREIDICESIF